MHLRNNHRHIDILFRMEGGGAGASNDVLMFDTTIDLDLVAALETTAAAVPSTSYAGTAYPSSASFPTPAGAYNNGFNTAYASNQSYGFAGYKVPALLRPAQGNGTESPNPGLARSQLWCSAGGATLSLPPQAVLNPRSWNGHCPHLSDLECRTPGEAERGVVVLLGMATQPDAERMAALERQRAEWEQQKAEDAAAGEMGRDAVADSAAVDDAAEDVYVMYEPHHLKEGKPHPDHVVETTALAGVNPPPVKYEHHLQARARHPQ